MLITGSHMGSCSLRNSDHVLVNFVKSNNFCEIWWISSITISHFWGFNPVSNNGQNFLIAIASLNHESSSCLPDQQLQHFPLFAVSNYIIITDIDHSFIFWLADLQIQVYYVTLNVHMHRHSVFPKFFCVQFQEFYCLKQ